MKICAVQIQFYKGDLDRSIEKHLKFVDLAISSGADMIGFPELSLTGYEPKLVEDLAIHENDDRLTVFQNMSDKHRITIGAGAPVRAQTGIRIGMILFQPEKARLTYSKQYLHVDERLWFVEGDHQVWLKAGNKTVAPAICYESLLPEHVESVMKKETDIYMAGVAKAANGVRKAFGYFPSIAVKYSITVVMANAIGPCDDFVCTGSTAIWNGKGKLLGQLDENGEGILMIDTDTETITKKII